MAKKPAIPAPVIAPETPPAPDPNLITNCLPGTTLHLGDGRKLEHGESADVSAAIAAQLRESGQAK